MSSQTVQSVPLSDSETIIHDATPAWSRWDRVLLLSIVTIPLLVGILGFVYVWLARRNTSYVVTDKRVMVKKGIFSTKTLECDLSQVRQMLTGESFLDSILDKGSIRIWAGGRWPYATINLAGTPDHHAVAETIRTHQ